MPLVSLLTFIAAIMAFLMYIRGDRGRDRRRCPRCWYDMTPQTTRACPECGHEASTEADLHSVRRQAWVGVLAAALLAASLFSGVRVLSRPSWVDLVPRPILRLALTMMVDPEPVPASADIAPVATLPHLLPGPKPAGKWTYLAWNQKYAASIERWGQLVRELPDTGSADVARLIAAAQAIDEWRKAFNSSYWSDSWVVKPVIERQRNLIAEMPDAVPLKVSKDQVFTVSRRAILALGFQPPLNAASPPPAWLVNEQSPVPLLLALLDHPDPVVRVFAIERVEGEPAGTPGLLATLDRLAQEDPDATVLARAVAVTHWRRGILGERLPSETPPK